MPIPYITNSKTLNQLLLTDSPHHKQRYISYRNQSVRAVITVKREHLRTLTKKDFHLTDIHFPKINASSCVRVLTNFYSTPLPIRVEMQTNMYSSYVEIYHQNRV